MTRRHNSRGQALVETALIIPIVILLTLGAYDVSIFASNHVMATTAVRNAARTGSLLGGKGGSTVATQLTCRGSVPPGFKPGDSDAADNDGDQDAIDQAVVQAVIRGTANMSYVTVQEIDIYQPKDPSGAYTALDLIDKYDGTGAELKTGGFDIQTYTLAQRCQGPLGSESELGVRLTWTYKPINRIVAPVFPNIVEYAVEKMAYCDPGCHQ